MHHVACVYRWGWLFRCFFLGRMSESEKFLLVSNYSTRGLADGVKKITPGLRHSSEVSVISCAFFRHVPTTLNDSNPRLPPPGTQARYAKEREREREAESQCAVETVGDGCAFPAPSRGGATTFCGNGLAGSTFLSRSTHRAEEPRVDDARPGETLEEHLDAEHEDGGIRGDGGGQPGARRLRRGIITTTTTKRKLSKQRKKRENDLHSCRGDSSATATSCVLPRERWRRWFRMDAYNPPHPSPRRSGRGLELRPVSAAEPREARAPATTRTTPMADL